MFLLGGRILGVRCEKLVGEMTVFRVETAPRLLDQSEMGTCVHTWLRRWCCQVGMPRVIMMSVEAAPMKTASHLVKRCRDIFLVFRVLNPWQCPLPDLPMRQGLLHADIIGLVSHSCKKVGRCAEL